MKKYEQATGNRLQIFVTQEKKREGGKKAEQAFDGFKDGNGTNAAFRLVNSMKQFADLFLFSR